MTARQKPASAALRAVVEAAPVHKVEEPPPREPRFRLMTAADLGAKPPQRWAVKGVVPAEGIGAIYGASGAGKSFLALHMLRAMSEGEHWFGYRTRPTPALYIALEGEAGIANRVRAMAITGTTCDALRFLATPLDIRSDADRVELIEAIRASGWTCGAVCLDTLNRAAPGMDENASDDMGRVIAGLAHLQRELGGVVIAVHHTGKDTTKGLRGHSSLRGALDFAVEVIRDNDRREVKVDKAKESEDGATHAFRLHVVELGEDEDGDMVTSCIVRPDENAAQAERRPSAPGGGNQRIAWTALGELLRESKAYGRESAPPTRPCVELEAAVEAVGRRLACEDKRRSERARAAITGLVSRGLLGLQGGWLWLT